MEDRYERDGAERRTQSFHTSRVYIYIYINADDLTLINIDPGNRGELDSSDKKRDDLLSSGALCRS